MNNTKKKQRGRLGETWHQLKKNKFAIVGLVIIVIVLLIAVFAPVLAPYSYDTQSPRPSICWGPTNSGGIRSAA